jgi:hypothetical protein
MTDAIYDFLRSNVNIWIEEYQETWPNAVYHPSSQWLRENGYPEIWANGI